MDRVEAPKMPDRLWLNKYLLRPGMLYKAQDAPAQETEYIRADLAELTWDDMKTINIIGGQVIDEHLFDNWTEKQVYEEVLRRFKESKVK